MSKLKSRIFGGKTPSSQDSQEEKGGLTVHLYHDVDTPAADQLQHFPERDTPYIAEEICVEVAKKLNISSGAFHLFALATVDLQSYFPPNHEVHASQVVFRLRFRPHNLDQFKKGHKEAFSYYYLQIRDDFIKSRMDDYLCGITLERHLGMALLDLLRLALQYQRTAEWMKEQDPEKFIPKSARQPMKYFWDKKRIQANFLKECGPKYESHKNHTPGAIKNWYMGGLRKYGPHYGCEEFALPTAGDVLVVEPQRPHAQIYKYKKSSNNKKGEGENRTDEENICNIEDVMSVSVRHEVAEVQLDLTEGFPRVFKFVNATDAYGFASCLEGYYRMCVDYHCTTFCSKLVFSPLVENLVSIRSYGPVDVKWARDRLLAQHATSPEYNFILCQRQGDLPSFELLSLVETGAPGDSQQVKAVHFSINKLPNHKYQVNIPEEPMFDRIRDLLDHYNVSRSKHPNLRLNRCAPVKQPVDPRLYLCLVEQQPATSSDQSGISFHHKYPIIVPGVQVIQTHIANGEFTNVHKASWDGENEIVMVAVKHLAADASHLLEYFAQSVHKAAFWNHGTVISIHALCLASPMQVVMELAELGDMQTCLRSPSAPLGVLKVYHLVSAAEQIAQALTYLQEELADKSSGLGHVHGNIRCRNIMVCGPAREGALKVKLGDPGLVHLYNVQNIDHPVNKERFPWLAPELLSNLGKMTMFTDRYAFGVTLWELFSLGDRPFGMMAPHEIVRRTQQEGIEKLLPKPTQCPNELYSTMRRCCLPEVEARLPPRDMVKEIRAVLFRASVREYSELAWEPHPGTEHYKLKGDQVPGEEDALSELLQRTVTPHKASDNGLFDMRSAPILTKADMQPLAVNLLDPKTQQVLAAPPNLREFGIHDSGDGDGDVGKGLPLSNGVQDAAGSSSKMKVKGAEGGVSGVTAAPMSPAPRTAGSAIQSRPLPSLPAATDDTTIIARTRILKIFDEKLGQGHYGTVYKGVLKLPNGGTRDIAIKSLRRQMVLQYQKEFDLEIKIMLNLKHENIVEIIGQCPQKNKENPLLLLMEFVENGSLEKYLRDNKATLKSNMAQLFKWTYQIARGMKYLSEKNIIHRDLASRNVLIDKQLNAKISDFGLSRTLDPEKDYYRSDKNKELPVRWCAQEVLSERKFSLESDVWSYGVTVWEIFSLGAPPDLCKIRDLFSELHRGKRLGRPERCPEPVWRVVILPCWEFYPSHRPNFQKICSDIETIEGSIEAHDRTAS